ncbi:MAG: hypothetical protein ACLFM7_12360 [Bacteroidales bacterium]
MILKKRMKAIIVVMVLLFGAHSVMSCTVPVFQYAMERWNQSLYDGVLLYKGSLSQEEKATFAEFQEMLSKDKSVLNLRIEKLDVDSKSDEYDQLLEGVKPGNLPAMALWYPMEKGNKEPFWVGPLEMPVLENVIESEKAREVTHHLVGGSPVVWILIHPSDEDNKDETLNSLREKISETVASMKQDPQFKSLIENDGDEVSFPIVPMSAKSSEETVLLSMITGLRDDSSLDESVVIPVFGRARALTTFKADKITQDRIYNIMRFLMSPCACQIKMASPGNDLLMKANWEKGFESFAQQSTSPKLTGVMPDSGSANSSSTLTSENDSIIDLTTDQRSSFFDSKIVSSVGGIIGILVVIIGVLTVVVLKRR